MTALETRLIVALVVLAALGGWGTYEHFHLLHEGAAQYEAKVAAATAKAQSDRTAALAAQHTADVAMNNVIEEMYEKALAKSAADNTDLAQRLHNFEASRSCPALPGAPATPAGSDGAPVVPSRVDRAVDGVITSAGHDADQVIALQNYITKECK
jgi:hypothetical protein